MNNIENTNLKNQLANDWLIKEEPTLIKKIYDYYFKTDINISFDSKKNTQYLLEVSDYINKNYTSIFSSLSNSEKFILYLMSRSFGWIVYDKIENILKIISKLFNYKYEDLLNAIDNLCKKFILFKYERLQKYNLIYSPPIFLRNIENLLNPNEILKENDQNLKQISLPIYKYISIIAGLFSYIITYSPRTSEINEIHKLDLQKLINFFKDLSNEINIEKIIKKLIRFGFFIKFNNRIIINRNIYNSIINLSINEKLFFIFLYDFMNKFNFSKSAFMTLKILAKYYKQNQKPISLKELFFYYLNNENFIRLKSNNSNYKFFLQKEELKFILFIKCLIEENIVSISCKNKNKISIINDSIIINEPHYSILNNSDFSRHFQENYFIIEPNFEVIVEPNLNPSILLKLALISEIVTIQTVSIFKITKESIYKALAYGINKEEILNFLEKHSKHNLPDNVKIEIKNYLDELEINNIDNYQIIQIKSNDSSLLEENFKNKLILLKPDIFLIFEKNTISEVEQFCKKNRINYRFIHDFLRNKNYLEKFDKDIEHNIKHLHKLKYFFELYGQNIDDTNIKIDNII